MSMYKCFKSDFDNLTKKINHITKKLDKYNLSYHFEKISESIELINIVDYTNYDNIPSWQFKPKTINNVPMEIVTYDFEMESIKLGKYTPIAVIEHNTAELNDKPLNLIHLLDETITLDTKYRTIESKCDHCNTSHKRNKTVLIKDNKTNQIKQIGTSCIKEYTGIDALDIIKNYQEIHDIIVDNNNLYRDKNNYDGQINYVLTIDYLSACISLINKSGYEKDKTKYKAFDIALTEHLEQYKQLAQTIINYYQSKDIKLLDNFNGNIKTALQTEYTKESGFIAYAFIAYNKLMEQEKKELEKQENNKISEYVGNIGNKVNIKVKLINKFTYETNYSYYGEINYIYLFEDNNQNVYKWKTNKSLEKQVGEYMELININEILTIKGSIKAHEEYNGQKQTVLTRCKLI